MSEYIFVYGTLRKGFGNYGRFLDNSFSKFVGNAITKERYIMFVQGIPYVNKNYDYSDIKGEIYLIEPNVLSAIDQLEGHPSWYRREKVDCILENGEQMQAWIYFNDYVGNKVSSTGDYVDRKSICNFVEFWNVK